MADKVKFSFGNQILGTWFCNADECNAKYYPVQLREQSVNIDKGIVKCPACKTGNLIYDEAA
jgi:hypothetical protein